MDMEIVYWKSGWWKWKLEMVMEVEMEMEMKKKRDVRAKMEKSMKHQNGKMVK